MRLRIAAALLLVMTAAAPALPAAEHVQAHLARGLWDRLYRMDEVLARAGIKSVLESWHGNGMGFGSVGGWWRSKGWLAGFPWTAKDLDHYDLIVVGNINANCINKDALAGLPAFVERGGMLLMLGGRFSFGGSTKGTPIEAIGPATFTGPFDLVSEQPGLVLAPGPAASDAMKAFDWTAAPRTFWYHAVTLRDDAEVLLTAGDKPILIARTHGSGAVVLWLGTVMGDPEAGALPFWEWKDWEPCLAEVVRTMLERTRAARRAHAQAMRAPILAAIAEAAMEGTAVDTSVSALMPWCREAGVLPGVLDALAEGEKDISSGTAQSLMAVALALREPEYAEPARALLATGSTHRVRLGLVALAASGHADAAALAREALRSGAVNSAGDGPDAPADALSPMRVSVDGASLIREAGLMALAVIGSPEDAVSMLRLRQERGPGGVFPTGGEWPREVTEGHYAYQLAVLGALGCGRHELAGEAAIFLRENVYIICRARSNRSSVPGYVAPFQKALPLTRAHAAQVARLAGALPPAARKVLDAELAGMDEWRLIPLRANLAAE